MKKSNNPNKSYKIGLEYLQSKYKTESLCKIKQDAESIDDLEIYLLLEQYSLGYTIRFELYRKLCNMNIMKRQ